MTDWSTDRCRGGGGSGSLDRPGADVPERVHEIERRVAYQHDDRPAREADDRFTERLHLGADGTLEVSNISGDITVSRGSGTDARIDVVRTARGRDDADAKEQLSLVRVDINEHGRPRQRFANAIRTGAVGRNSYTSPPTSRSARRPACT